MGGQHKEAHQTSGKKVTFAPEESEESGKKKEEEEVSVNFQCVIGFAIRVDKGNNTNRGFDRKLSEGLTFLRDFVTRQLVFYQTGRISGWDRSSRNRIFPNTS